MSKADHKKSNDQTLVPVDVHPLAISQARAFANIARSLSVAIKNEGSQGELLAYLVNSGLAIELYLKGLMIAARAGKVTKGHDLEKLYAEFPFFLRDFLEFTFLSRRPTGGWVFSIHAITLCNNMLHGPAPHLKPNFESFEATLSTAKNYFVHARYYFERIDSNNWSIFEYAYEPIEAAIFSLDLAYQHLLAGSFQFGVDMLVEK
jgi:hypothetical protein